MEREYLTRLASEIEAQVELIARVSDRLQSRVETKPTNV